MGNIHFEEAEVQNVFTIWIQIRRRQMCGDTNEFPQLQEIGESIKFYILDSDEAVSRFCANLPYISSQSFFSICRLYGYPISVIRQLKYTDKMYRDAYYIYLSHLHFDIGRHCERLALFKGEYKFSYFFDSDCHDELQDNFLGTLVIRPSYNNSKENTLGRTLLNPFQLKNPFHYIRTARYKVTICGQSYIVDAFPFSNQHGDVLRCAETSVWALMEYYGTKYENYSTVLPSTILNWASKELPARTLPSDGLTYRQISCLLKTFHFEPRIYERSAYGNSNKSLRKEQQLKSMLSKKQVSKLEKKEQEDIEQEGLKQNVSGIFEQEKASEEFAALVDKKIKEDFDNEQKEIADREKEKGEIRQFSLQNLFHYYVESGIPLITAVCNNREKIHHSVVIIGHDERSPKHQTRKFLEMEEFTYGEIYFIDSSVLYERYITIDDNQYPYRSERFDSFSVAQNCKVEAFIVPLYRHILLDAESAVNIIETIYRDYNYLIRSSLEQLVEENKEWHGNSIDNPVVLRYYLTTSRGFVSFRNKDTDYLEEKIFYNTTSFPKFIWVGEYSTLELYREGNILGEIVLDATAPKYSGMGAIIAVRFGGRCASRQTNESPEELRERLQRIKMQQARLIYKLYTNNLQKGDL